MPIGPYEKIIVDEATTLITYIGYAVADYTPTSSAVWAIQRITQAAATSPPGVTVFEWAGRPDSFINIWDNRASLTYVA